MASSDAYNALVLSGIKGVGPSTVEKIFSLSTYSSCSIKELCEMASAFRKQELDPEQFDTARRNADFQVEMAQLNEFKIISQLDFEYSKLLKASSARPSVLYVKGEVTALNSKTVAVIGTREPTVHGVEIAKRITRWLVEREWAIVSGLAIGCDSIAHRAAVDSRGVTIAVMAHGLQTVSPSQNKGLAADILDCGGALVSEFGFGVKPIPTSFVIRDKTQAGLSCGVIMIQSDLKGGSLHASRAAIKDGRPLIVPYPTNRDVFNNENKILANLMLSNGAQIDKCKLLKCAASDLGSLYVVKGRSDYDVMESQLNSSLVIEKS